MSACRPLILDIAFHAELLLYWRLNPFGPKMSYYAQQQAPPPPQAYPPEQAPAYVAPPPAGYPTRDGGVSSAPVPIETKSRGDGFWKGCCAALCCCWVLDVCF
ncbi:hypothetical protein MUK42_04337 [Musa troglodytarum]|uniref:Cysteine-rich transmembrane domain-containing protein n=1 Tax=Musa troglodytarum TaxID=320322 RepID=A0A9E7KYA7_9LILI|nr:hypothetical protein MUK42_04337 [Musa troglodytarum]